LTRLIVHERLYELDIDTTLKGEFSWPFLPPPPLTSGLNTFDRFDTGDDFAANAGPQTMQQQLQARYDQSSSPVEQGQILRQLDKLSLGEASYMNGTNGFNYNENPIPDVIRQDERFQNFASLLSQYGIETYGGDPNSKAANTCPPNSTCIPAGDIKGHYVKDVKTGKIYFSEKGWNAYNTPTSDKIDWYGVFRDLTFITGGAIGGAGNLAAAVGGMLSMAVYAMDVQRGTVNPRDR
jgi:hypothetical protein